MKPFLILSCLLILTSSVALAQEHKPEIPKRSTHIIKSQLIGKVPVALVVITHDKEYLADMNSIKRVKDKWIGGAMIDPFRIFPTDTLRYGANAAFGVTRFIIDDKRYPKVYLKFINSMKYIGPADPNIPQSE